MRWRARFRSIRRARLQGWIEAGAVKVDGQVPRPRDKVAGRGARRHRGPASSLETTGQRRRPAGGRGLQGPRHLRDQQAGRPRRAPGAGNASHTLQNALLALDPGRRVVPRAGLVHRLDKDTSGLMVIARTPEAHAGARRRQPQPGKRSAPTSRFAWEL